MRKPDRPARRPSLLPFAAALALASPLRAQTNAVQLKPGQRPRPLTAQRTPGPQNPRTAGPQATTPTTTPTGTVNAAPDAGQQPARPSGPAYPHAIAPQSKVVPAPQTQVKPPPPPARASEPPVTEPVDKKEIHTSARTVVMSFDKRDLAEVIQFVSQFTQRNFILPERVSGKITILSNSPIPADEVWNVFVAALDANNWAVYPVGRYWKLVEKKQSSRANVPLYVDPDTQAPAIEQMVTKLFKLHYVEADQMRNVLNQFTSRDSDFQIFPPDTLIISDLGLNMRRLEKLVEQLDQPGGSEEIHIVSVQYAGAQELAQKLNEIFTAQTGQKPGAGRQIGVVQPGQPMQVPQPGAQTEAAGGPLQVSKILAEERTNKLIVIAGAKSFNRVMELVKQLDVPTGEGGVHVYYLENAKAEEVASTLQALAQGLSSAGAGKRPGTPTMGVAPQPAAPGGVASAELFSGQVKITADKNTNSLVVIASQADYRNLVKVVERLDIRRRQVFVEAVIMEVNLDNNLNVGVSTHGGTVIDNVSFRGAKGQAPLVVGSELGGLSSLGGVTSLGALGGFLAGLQGPPITVPGTNFALPSFAILLNALQSSNDVNVISTPHVIMSDNTEGEITVGQNVPFQAAYSPGSSALTSLVGSQTGATPGTNPVSTAAASSLLGLGGLGSLYAPIQRQNVELRLRIKPQINESDYVRLEVDEQTEEIASVDPQLGPTTSKRTAKTTVVAKDQETVVLGGMIQERTVRSVSKVPVLGSLPVLGWLFRNETTKRTKTNLLLFLTPYIIRDQTDYRRIFERKMAERAEFVKRFYGEGAEYETVVDYQRKLGPLSHVRLGVQEELEKFENGGPGGDGEKVIGPAQRYSPKELDKGGAAPRAPSPAPVPAEPKKEPTPGVQAPPEPEQKPAPGR